MSIRLVSILAVTAALGLAGCAQVPPRHAERHPGASAPAPGQGMPMARMDEHMKTMRTMHDRMAGAKTPEERNALMAEHRKLMQEGMAMMGGMGGMMGHMQGSGGDPAARQQMMEKRMEMMQSMMQMMMDRLPPVPAKP
ncbi:hypothetical protein [Polaromonas sp.]|uniref:hypothetical protein n=1 Tax=Polaromonas sp. TaxID=1869339 RepID=UPI0032662027